MSRDRQPTPDRDAAQRADQTGRQTRQGSHTTNSGARYSQHGNAGRSHPTGQPRRGGTQVPTGLRLVTITMGALGGLLVFAALLLLTGGSELPGGVGAAIQLAGLLTGGLGGAHLLAAYGLWTVRPWGRRRALWLAVGSLSLSLLTLLNGGPAGLLGVVLYGGISWYLYTNEQLYRSLQRTRPS